MSKSKTDLLVRQRFQNPLPAPSFPPKLLTIKTDPTRYATYDFLTPLSLEREVPMIVDSEGGMHLDQSLVPGYWESGTSSSQAGRSGKMAPDLSIDAPELDDEDLELLVDPPGTINPAAAGIMPTSSGGASLDMVGTGRSAGIIANVRSPAAALDRRKKDVAWIRRSDYAVASDAMNQAKKEAMVREIAAAHHAVKPAALTPEEQMQAIIHTFSVIEKTDLSNLKHPTKPHLQAVESYDILPDEELWANQYALFKFADNPNDRKSGHSSQPVASSSSAAASIGLIRPLENDEESGSNRVAYFVPDDEEAANAYNTRRHAGANADQQLLDGADTAEDVEQEEETDEYGFKFVRDYDAIRRETNKEYIFVIEDGDGENGEGASATKQEEDIKDGKSRSRRQKGAYYVPLVSHTLLRKRRARKGEVRNDYDDLGIEFWGGMLVQLGGKEVFPQDEAEARKLELESIRNPPTVGDAVEGDSEQQSQSQQPEQTQVPEAKPELAVNGNHVMAS